ncbi:O-antigen ligase [Gordonia sp. 'Campus']|uniref:O-antigen ligase family protein n=1 Tax=Gordonia sp. 'Campus' TaxID=2915824 RepID=UPI001EE4D107|nr:O-antigen ligase family protein [Gordonia sp. 'Campus']
MAYLPVVGAVLVVLVLAGAFVSFIYRRPQRGLLVLAALTPLDGLLDIAPVPGIASAWKEGVLALTLICAYNRRIRPADRTGPPLHMPWWPAAAVLVAFGVVSALYVYGPIGLYGVKVTFFYLFVVLALWLTPFDARDRDRLVSVIMALGVITTLVGIGQQLLGPARLVELGYTYGEQVRSSGPLFRTFSTFNQPFGFGLFVMLALLVGGAVALSDTGRRRNQLFLACWPIMAVTMATSVVRAAILGLAVGVIWLAALRFRRLIAPLLALGVFAVVALPFLPSSITKVFFSSSSLSQRGSGWGDIFASIWVHPLGTGLASSGSAADAMSAARGETTPTITAGADGTVQQLSRNYQPDNYYVKLLLELGPIGLWLFLALIVTAVIWCVQYSRRMPDPDGAFVLGVSASMVAAMVACLVATYFEIFPLDFFFWLLLGAAGCATAQHESRTVRLHFVPEEAESRPTSANS